MIKEVSAGRKCPLCSKLTEALYRPFCSKRCQQLDLGKWLNESYAIPGEEMLSTNDEDDTY